MKNAIITILVGIILVLFVLKFRDVSFFDAATVQKEQQKLEESRNRLQMIVMMHQGNLNARDAMFAMRKKNSNKEGSRQRGFLY